MLRKYLTLFMLILGLYGQKGIAFADNFDKDKPVILLLHGTPFGADVFTPLLNDQRLLQVSIPVATDRTGYGSKKISVPVSFYDQVTEVEKQISEFTDKQKIILVGYSFGSVIAMHLAEKYPSRFSKIVLVSGVYQMGKSYYEIGASLLKYFNRAAAQFYSDISVKNLQPIINNNLEHLKKIKAPVYVIHGENDSNLPPSSIENLIPIQPKVFIRPGKNHSLLTTDSDFITHLLIEIVQENLE